jgi:bifunctional non-homologous end joining protein LigD
MGWESGILLACRASPFFPNLQPMLATLTDAPFDDSNWVFETKWDGLRMVTSIECGSVTLYSRNGKVVGDRYRPVGMAFEKVKRDAALDGELVALDRTESRVSSYCKIR